MKVDAKVVDFAILGTPQIKRNGFKVLGYFTLLLRPMRIEGCSLVTAPNGRFAVWTPGPISKLPNEPRLKSLRRHGWPVSRRKKVAV